MQNGKRKKQTFKIKGRFFIILTLIIVVTIISVMITKRKKEPVINTDVNLLKGTFVYNNTSKYEFNENNSGALYEGKNKYEYTYFIHDQQVTLTFKDTSIHEATYTFYFINDDLKLIGGTGTVGGEYILKKEK